MPKKRLLITGASGMLGYALCRRALPVYNVYGVCYRGDIQVKGVTPVRANLTDRDALAELFEKVQPAAVIHAAALSQPNACEQQPDASEKINLRATEEVARFCAGSGAPLVFVSTDLVFDGQNPPYSEDDPVSPICMYGRHKAVAEKAVREIFPEAAICRMPLMIGQAPGTGSGFLGHMVRTLRDKRVLTLFTDEIRTPVDTGSAAEGLLMALEKYGALLHLGGHRRMSRYTLGCLVADILKADHTLLKPLRIEALPMPAPRSPDVSLENDRACAMGYEPESVIHVIEKLLSKF